MRSFERVGELEFAMSQCDDFELLKVKDKNKETTFTLRSAESPNNTALSYSPKTTIIFAWRIAFEYPQVVIAEHSLRSIPSICYGFWNFRERRLLQNTYGFNSLQRHLRRWETGRKGTSSDLEGFAKAQSTNPPNFGSLSGYGGIVNHHATSRRCS